MKKIFYSIIITIIFTATSCQQAQLKEEFVNQNNLKKQEINLITDKEIIINNLKANPNKIVLKNYTDTTTGVSGDLYKVNNQDILITSKEPIIDEKLLPWIVLGQAAEYAWLDVNGNIMMTKILCKSNGSIDCLGIFNIIIIW